jgi:uncharacterized damage-inducible protein DinB
MPESRPTLPATMLELLRSTLQTTEALLEAGDAALPVHTTHVCGHDKDTWTLLTNLIDHETEHIGQVAQARYESRETRTALERVLAEWLEVRARFIGSLIGLSEEQFHSPTEDGQWTFYEVADHLLKLERHALKTMRADGALPAAAQ